MQNAKAMQTASGQPLMFPQNNPFSLTTAHSTSSFGIGQQGQGQGGGFHLGKLWLLFCLFSALVESYRISLSLPS